MKHYASVLKKVFSLTRSQACETLLRVYKSYYNIHRFDGGESAIREGGAGKGRTDEEVIEAVEQNDYPLISRCDFFDTPEVCYIPEGRAVVGRPRRVPVSF